MNDRKIHIDDEETKDIKPLSEKPLVEVSEIVPQKENGEDLYLVMGNKRYQFAGYQSPLYLCKEYKLTLELKKDAIVTLAHVNGKVVPIHNEANCGYTLVGKAKKYFKALKALTADGEPSDDQEYVYINEHSQLQYIGETETHTLFIRVYDMNGGMKDRWVVIYLD